MLTVKALCSQMEASGRHLLPRTARDWWTKGLLPRPCRRWFRQRSETFWTDPRVIQQARTTYDLLARHSGTDIIRLYLWLLGFPIDLRSIRDIYLELNNRYVRAVRAQIGNDPYDIGEKLAEMLVRQQQRQINKDVAPVDARYAFKDLATEFLAIFFGSKSEFASEGLAELLEKAASYVYGAASWFADLHLCDEDIATCALYWEQFVSLPAQREMIRTASDYELMRARRLIRFVLGYFRRVR